MKRTVMLILCVAMLFALSVNTFAAPNAIGVYESQGASGLITITNPAKKYSTTYSRSYSISGFAASGSHVSIYIYNSATALYEPYIKNNSYASATVGASGIFVIPVNLSSGKNSFLVRCEKDGVYQNTVFDINVLSTSMFNIRDNLKNIIIN